MRCAFHSECLVASASLAVLVLTLGGSAEAKQKPGKKGRESETRCLEVRVTSPQSQERRRTGRFSATEILDLRVEVRLPRQIESSQQVVVKLFTPDGHLYQDLPLTTVQGELGDTSATTRRHRARGGSSEPLKKASGNGLHPLPRRGNFDRDELSLRAVDGHRPRRGDRDLLLQTRIVRDRGIDLARESTLLFPANR